MKISLLFLTILLLTKETVFSKDTLNKKAIITLKLDSNITKEVKPIVIVDTLNSVTFNLKKPEQNEYFEYFKIFILPFFTLLLGIVINRSLDWLNERKKIRKAGKKWMGELTCLEKPIKTQIEYIDKFKEAHLDNVNTIPDMSIIPILKCETFNYLDKSDLIEFLERYIQINDSDASQTANRIVMFTEIVKIHYQYLNEKFTEYLKNISLNTTLINDNLNELLSLFADYGVSIEREIKADPLNDKSYKKIFDHFNLVYEHKSLMGDVFKLNNDFFLPLASEFGKQRLNPSLLPMMNILRKCMEPIKKIQLEKFYLNENLNTLKKYLELDSQDLTKLLEDLNKLKKQKA